MNEALYYLKGKMGITRKCLISTLLFCALMAAAVASPVALTAARVQGKGVNVEKRISFARGRSSATVKGFIADRMTTHEYKLGARAGQTLTVKFSSNRNDVDMCISYPPGSASPDDSCGPNFSAVLPEDGDYSIIVDSKRENTSYTITVSIR